MTIKVGYFLVSAVLLASLTSSLFACTEEETVCQYSGATLSCDEAAALVLGDDGLCVEEGVSEREMAQDCSSWPSADWRDCWIACVEQANSCDVAGDCQSTCTGTCPM